MPKSNKTKLLSIFRNSNTRLLSIVFILVFAAIGYALLSQSRAVSTLNADFNSDSTVNVYDLSILATNWGKTSVTHAQGDANNDSTINIYDLSIVASEWGQTITITPTPIPIPTPIVTNTYNVVDYGAKHDGVTDDVSSIERTIHAIVAIGGGVVYLPTGTYRVNAGHASGDPLMNQNIDVPSNVTIRGAGIGKTIINGTGISSASIFGADSADNIAIEDLSITMTKALHSSDGDGIKLQNVTNSSFSRVYIENAYIGTNCIGCQNITYTDCEIYNALLGFSICNNSEGITGQYETTNNITLNNCEASYCAQCGFYAYYWGVNGKPDSTRVTNVSFNGCYSHDNQWTGFYSIWSNHCTWNNCRSENNGSWGFYLDNAKDYFVIGCTAAGNGAGNEVPYITGGSTFRQTI